VIEGQMGRSLVESLAFIALEIFPKSPGRFRVQGRLISPIIAHLKPNYFVAQPLL
jgi:hypothetical protein